MHWFKNNLANFFTLGNLTCGFLGIIGAFNGSLLVSFWLMIAATILDFLDGFIARATKTTSKIGADLDSLADMVTFGVLPAIMFYQAIPSSEIRYLAVLVPLFSAWRLARFNNDTRSSMHFYGLPTPANAILIGAFVAEFNQFISCFAHVLSEETALLFSPVLVGALILTVSNVKLLSNKIVNFNISEYKWHLLVVIVGLTLILIFGYLGVSLAIISYVLISIIATFASSKKAE